MLKALVHRAHEPALSIEHAACPGLALPFLILCRVQPLCPAGWGHPIPFLHPFIWDGRETGGQLPTVALAHSSFSYTFQDSSFISFVEVGEWVLEDCWWLKENPFSTITNLTRFSQIFTPVVLKPMWVSALSDSSEKCKAQKIPHTHKDIQFEALWSWINFIYWIHENPRLHTSDY